MGYIDHRRLPYLSLEKIPEQSNQLVRPENLINFPPDFVIRTLSYLVLISGHLQGAYKFIMSLTPRVMRPLLLVTRFMQWSSAVIVLGITSYYVHEFPHGAHLTYWLSIVSSYAFANLFMSYMPSQKDFTLSENKWLTLDSQAAISTLLFLPAFVSPFLPIAGRVVLLIDIVMSYL